MSRPGCWTALRLAGAGTAAGAASMEAARGRGCSLFRRETVFAVAILAAGEALFFLWRRRKRRADDVGDGESRFVMGEADDVLIPEAASEASGVRQLMERLVESLVSGGLDDVVLLPKDPHPQYGRIYRRHQPRLRSALTSLAYSLQMAMAQKPLAECETPGRAHAQLRAIILDLARDVAALDRHPGEQDGVGTAGLDGVLDAKEDFATRAYEDILATAIVNKVMERSTLRNNNNNKRNTNNNNNNFVSSLEVRLGSVEDSPESGTSSYNGSWTGSSLLDHSVDGDLDSDPLSLMIEECIEEVTTITGTSSSSASSSSLDERSEGEELPRDVPLVRRRRRRRSARRRGSSSSASLPLPPSGPPSLIAGLSLLKQRVPFPELGVDIVDVDWSSGESELSDSAEAQRPVNGLDGGYDAEGRRASPPDGAEQAEDAVDEDRPASCLELVTPMQSWEDNWLFQSKRIRKPAAQYAHHPVPVPMLVPNPSEDFRALIGDVDAEETSDLSECSDDALEEVVLAGMKPKAESDQFSEDLSVSEAAGRPLLDGLAETCNLELLRRAAPALSTAPAPRAARTNRTANLEGPASSPDRLSPLIRSAATSPVSKGRQSPNDMAERWARDQDAEMTILYDTPTRREAPAKDVPVKEIPKKEVPAMHRAVPKQKLAVDSRAQRSVAAVAEVEKSAVEATRVEPVSAAPKATAATLAERPDGAEEKPLQHQQVEGERQVNGRMSPPPEVLDNEDLFTPPRPGTIAEREHRKWLEATPLPNNPYSPENIERRLKQRASLTGQPLLPPALSPTPAADSLPPPDDSSLHIALRVDPDPKKYGRDFYINSGSGLRRAHSTSVADRRIGHLETPIAPWSSAVRTNGDGGSEDSSPVPTPSVRELAKQFLSQPPEQPAPQPSRTKSTDASKVVIVGKNESPEAPVSADIVNKHDKKAVRQVHSLTARSMSREFREGLRHLAVGRPAAAPGAQPTSAPSSTPAGPEQHSDRPDPEGARQPAEAE
ncbi:uncharacterized protein LOC113216045 isoform X2 [Frankliniella occidentalis]|uniref:Uncharacterized protein LOC113216045 isoform X2 n=1 Tax=Frankliniella occidentalis TaxID=133901 RepID=A0A9C6TVK1_FRAOC|nr:uncharacterized protein LOC113216045 isoform X2 [Frankliniella occidentalis]